MADQDVFTPSHYRRDANKASVRDIAGQRRRQLAVAVGKEKREALTRTKRLCREALSDDVEISTEGEMNIDQEQTVLDAQTSQTVEELKSVLTDHIRGKGAAQKKVEKLCELRRLLSKSEVPPVKAALQAGAVSILVQCLSFGSPDEQLEAAWCLTNIAAGELEETKSLMPALPLLIAHIGEKSSVPVAEQCAWALGNVAGEGEDLRNILLAQGALLPLSRLMMSNKGSTARTAAWALSNLIKGPCPKAATELIRIKGVLDAIIQHLRKLDEELATEVAWVVVYLSALSEAAVELLVKSDVVQLLVGKLAVSESLQLLIPVLRSLGNLVTADSYMTDTVLIVGQCITVQMLSGLIKCLKSEHRVLKKEAAWVLSNIAAGSVEHKEFIYSSEATLLLIHLLSSAPFDIRKEVAYILGNLCVSPAKDTEQPSIIVHHLVSLVNHGCVSGFLNLVRSADIQSARLELQFLELEKLFCPNYYLRITYISRTLTSISGSKDLVVFCVGRKIHERVILPVLKAMKEKISWAVLCLQATLRSVLIRISKHLLSLKS